MSDRRPPDDLLAGVLRRTGSDPCARALRLLGEDGPSDALDDRLLREHVDHCASCARLERVLLALRQDLPALAPREAPDLVPAVVARTTARPRRLVPRWAARPRLAVELGYAAAVLTLALVGATGARTADRDALFEATRSGTEAVETAGGWLARSIAGTGRAITRGMTATLDDGRARTEENGDTPAHGDDHERD